MENNIVKGFKVFNPDWSCRGFKYQVGQVYEMDNKPKVCNDGFHFCEKASDCFCFYEFNPENKVAEVEAIGLIDSDGKKSCTNKIRIVREVPWDEVLRIVNEGKNCTGYKNTGNRNTGNRNTGNSNTGNYNTGNYNTGNYNTGCYNAGNRNTGYSNTGCYNTGNWNIGNRNTGDWNKSSFNNGCFMTIEPKIMMFNKPSEWTYSDWLSSEAKHLLDSIPKNVVEWVLSKEMTDEEKAAHPEYVTTGGYLKVSDKSECGQFWWDELNRNKKEIIKSIPNFDKDIFEEITGIKVD